MDKVKFCLEVWGTDYQKIKQTCLLAEKCGYYGFYYGESLTDIDLDCWTVLSSLISLTETIKLGPVITYIIPEYRSIPLLAKQCISFQDISGGRLELRTGSGALSKYSLSWWNPFGIYYQDAAKRISIFEEGIALLSQYLGKSTMQNKSIDKPEDGFSPSQKETNVVNFDGRFFKAHDASMKTPKKDVPLTIAAQNKSMMRITAKYADMWEISYLTPREYGFKKRKFDEIVSSIDAENKSYKDGDRELTRSIELDVIIASTQEELKSKKKGFTIERDVSLGSTILNRGLIGTPDLVQQKVMEYIDMGVNQFLLAFQNPYDLASIKLFMNSMKSLN